MRIWPKAVVLVLITLWFGFVHAGPLGEERAKVLNDRLEGYYARELSADQLIPDEFPEFATVPHVLAAVLRHARDFEATDLHAHLLFWAAELTFDFAPAGDEPFQRAVVGRQLTRLLGEFKDRTVERDDLTAMFDALQLWSIDQLPFLAAMAGTDDRDGYFARLALDIIPEYSPDLTLPMVRALRALPDRKIPLSETQHLLLAQSGHANADDLAGVLLLTSYDYANAANPLDVPILREGRPLRDLVESMLEDYGNDHPIVVEAFDRAEDWSDSLGDRGSTLVDRQSFFRAFANATLFGAVAVEELYPELKPANDRVSRYLSDGNVYHVRFDCKSLFAR